MEGTRAHALAHTRSEGAHVGRRQLRWLALLCAQVDKKYIEKLSYVETWPRHSCMLHERQLEEKNATFLRHAWVQYAIRVCGTLMKL
jgi:hypothetical protein